MEQAGREETPTASTNGVSGGGGAQGRSGSLAASDSAPSNTNANSNPTNAKWGNACAQCAAAKAKCSRQNSPGSKCDRCERLGKDCTNQVHRPRKKRAVRPSLVDAIMNHTVYRHPIPLTHIRLIVRQPSLNNDSMGWSTFSKPLGISEASLSQTVLPLTRSCLRMTASHA